MEQQLINLQKSLDDRARQVMRDDQDAPAPSEEIADALEMFFASFTQGCDEATYKAYWLALFDLPEALVGEALAKAIRSPGQWRPPPGEC